MKRPMRQISTIALIVSWVPFDGVAASLEDPLLQLDQTLSSSFQSKSFVEGLSPPEKCSIDFLKGLGWKLEIGGTPSTNAQSFDCKDGFAPQARFATEADLKAALPDLIGNRATRCRYQLKVRDSIKKAAAVMEKNRQIVFDTESGKLIRNPDGSFETIGGSFFKCSGTLNGTSPFAANPNIPWTHVVTDPCTSVQAFISGLVPVGGKSPMIGMDCANALQANQYVYTYLKHDLDGDGVLNDRECRIFTAAYADRKWEFSPLNFSSMTKNPFVGEGIQAKSRPSRQLAQAGSPFLSGIRAVVAMKQHDVKAVNQYLGGQTADLTARYNELERKERTSSLTPAEKKEKAALYSKLGKNAFKNENLLITEVSEAAAQQWAQEEFTGNASTSGATGRFEQDFNQILTSVQNIRATGLKDPKKEVHVAEVILASEEYHAQLLDPSKFPVVNGKRDFSRLEPLLKQLEPEAVKHQPPVSGVTVQGKIDRFTVKKMAEVLSVLLEPRFREVKIYAHPSAMDARNNNLASLVLRQSATHRSRQFTFEIYPETEQAEQFNRFSESIRRDCQENLKPQASS